MLAPFCFCSFSYLFSISSGCSSRDGDRRPGGSYIYTSRSVAGMKSMVRKWNAYWYILCIRVRKQALGSEGHKSSLFFYYFPSNSYVFCFLLMSMMSEDTRAVSAPVCNYVSALLHAFCILYGDPFLIFVFLLLPYNPIFAHYFQNAHSALEIRVSEPNSRWGRGTAEEIHWAENVRSPIRGTELKEIVLSSFQDIALFTCNMISTSFTKQDIVFMPPGVME